MIRISNSKNNKSRGLSNAPLATYLGIAIMEYQSKSQIYLFFTKQPNKGLNNYFAVTIRKVFRAYSSTYERQRIIQILVISLFIHTQREVL